MSPAIPGRVPPEGAAKGAWCRAEGRHSGSVCSRRSVAILVAFVLLLAACAARQSVPPAPDVRPLDQALTPDNQQRLEALWAARQRGNSEADYEIAPGDLLRIMIYGFHVENGGNFDVEVRVDDQGMLSLPMTKPLHAAGLSVKQLQAEIVGQLQRDQVLRQPMVSVFLKDYQGQGVIVLGAVPKPGMYYLTRGGQTLIDVISMAGGLTQGAGNYILLRPADPNNGANAVPPAALTLPTANNALPAAGSSGLVIDAHPGSAHQMLLALPMRGGDQIIIPEAGIAFIEGEVAKPGPVPLVYGMTLTQVIAASGGLTYPADQQHITVIRSTGAGQSKQWNVDLDRITRQEINDVVLERNDRIVVPADGSRAAVYGVYKTLTAIVHFGVGGTASVW
ncbi:MAG: polysaccharide biosynthesis/export family protein [Candidatus Binatia bacterium]